jgi:hypothetical protein
MNRDGHALVRFPPQALLLDLASGALFQLNPSATFIWDRWLRGTSTDKIAEDLTSAHKVPLSTAREHVAMALTKSSTPPPRWTAYHYERSFDRYVFSLEGVPIVTVEQRGEYLELTREFPRGQREIRNVLLAISPKLLALRGHFVMHASAVLLDRAVIAFSGESGAGKTTTARALVRAGATPVCEDKLIVRLRGDNVEVGQGAEQAIDRWSQVAADQLYNGARAQSPELDTLPVINGATLTEIGFLDAARRSGSEINSCAQIPLENTGAIFRNSFYGSDVGEDWARQLHTAAALAAVVRGQALSMPEGLTALDVAATNIVRRGSLRL